MLGSVVWRRRVLCASPDLIAAAMCGFSVGPMFLLLVGHFSAAAAVPAGLVGAAIACRLAGIADRTDGTDHTDHTDHTEGTASRRDVLFAAAALLIALAWFAYNVNYSAQDVYATRDPATYTIAGEWLVHHGSLQIHVHPEIFGNPVNQQLGSSSYAVVGDGLLNAQGDHLLPVLLAISGSLFGTTALLSTNTVLAALALFVFFGLARRVVGPLLGLMAMLALALSMPYVYVGRDTYTEPLTMLFLMGGLLFAHRGWTGRRPQDWILAGLASGAAVCARVDSYGAIVGIVAAATLFVAVARADQRRSAVRCAGALLLGAAAPLTLGYLDLTHLSKQYFGSQHGNITHLIALLAFTALLAPVCVWLAWNTRVRRWLTSDAFALRAPQLTAVLLGVVFVALVTRPAWQTTHGPCFSDLANMQRTSGVAVDCTRTYNEQTLRWQALYFGWPTIALAFAGYLVLVTALVRRRDYRLVGTLAMGLSMSVLYLYNSEVSPDQPWAMRRYVPVVLPLFLIAAGSALRALWRRRGAGAALWRPVVIGLALTAVLFPLAVTWPLRTVREEIGQLRQLRDVCTAVGKHGAVLFTDHETLVGYGQSVRSFCDVPADGLDSASAQSIKQISDAVRAHGRVLFVLGQSPQATGGQPGHAFSVVNVVRWPTVINTAPTMPAKEQYAVWLSRVDADGRREPIAAITPIR